MDGRKEYEDALRRHDELVALIMSGTLDPAADQAIRDHVPSGIYEHFKSSKEKPMFYSVFGVGRDVDDGPYRVAYRALYMPHLGMLAFRQLVGPDPEGEMNGFLMPVDRPGYIGTRFRLVLAAHLTQLP